MAALAGGEPILHFLANDVIAKLDTFIADENRGARNEFSHLVLAFTAKRAVKQSIIITSTGLVVIHDLSFLQNSQVNKWLQPVISIREPVKFRGSLTTKFPKAIFQHVA
ncbi:hypothetical protein NONS58_27600 [Nitrosococcus oceani]|nr:hypothetical protein NONS58_27600 [Nitrosococcus oceani]